MSIPLRRSAQLILACCVLLLPGCGRPVEGTPTSQLGNADQVAGLPVIDGPSGLRSDPKPASRIVENTDNGEIDRLAASTASDLDEFWTDTYPKTFWAKFHPVSSLMSWDSRGPENAEFCDRPTLAVDNAAYCTGRDVLGWDRGVLMPGLVRLFGQMAVPITLAHEYGHAVAYQSEMVDDKTPILVNEQMADCLAGVYLRWVAEGNSGRFTLSTGDGLNRVIAALITFRDDPIDPAESDDAHGSAFDRVSAFQLGFTEGAAKCTRIDAAELNNRHGGLPATLPPAESGELPVTVDVLRNLATTLNAVFSLAEPPRLSFAGATCNGPQHHHDSPAAVYCPDTNTVAIDIPRLSKLAAPTHDQGRITGDYSAYSIVISRYALSVLREHHLPLDDGRTALRVSCLTGSASAALARSDARHPNTLTLKAGDLDEAIWGLLTNGIVASDVNGTVIPAGFSRIDTFRDGVGSSVDRCLKRYS